MRSRRTLLLTAVATLAFAAPAHAFDYVGLGDSYSSGTGTASSYPDNCERNNLAYPSLIDPSLAGTGVNHSCSGARTNNITADSQTPGNAVAQIDLGGLDASTDFVTLQIGGNDAGFVDTLISCGNPLGDCAAAIETAKTKAETELPPKLHANYTAVRARAPNAKIAIVGYPRIFRPNQSCNTFFSASEVNDLNAAADLLDELTRDIAHQHDLAFIDPRPIFIGHGACDTDEWINGLGSSNSFGNSYHPKAVGHSSGYAPVVLAGINGIPVTSFVSAPPNPSNSTSPSFQFGPSTAGTTFQCKLDSGAYTACASTKQYTGVAEGSHTLTVRAFNADGNVDQTPISHPWTIDTSAPPVAIDAGGPSGTVAQDDATFAFASTDGTAALACKVDGEPFAPCTSPKSYSGLDDGDHAFSVRATDAAGNAATASRSWEVDTTPPQATINLGPSDPTPDGDASFEFALDDPGAQAECRLDSDEFAACESPEDLTGVPEGPHTFQVRGVDAVGNPGAPASFSWTVDQSSFPVSITSGPPPLGNLTTADFAFESDDPVPALLTWDCKLDDEEFAACTTDTSAHYDGLADGEHTFTARTTKLGSIVATDSQSFTIDTAAPDTSIDAGPPALTQQASAQLDFSSEDTGASFECRLDSSSPAGWDPCISPQAPSGLSDGPHTFDVRAFDEAGNVDTTPATRTWTVDTTAPTPTITSKPGAITNVDPAQFGFISSEGGSSFQCRLDSIVATEFEPCTTTQSYPDLADGSHTLEVRATDPAGNTSASPVSYSWTIDATAPTVTIDSHPPDPNPSNLGQSFSFSTGEPGSSYQCRLGTPDAPGTFSACSATPPLYTGLDDGDYVLEVKAKDPLENEGAPATYAWRIDTTTPTVAITSGPASNALVRSAVADFEFSANEEEVFYECRLDSALESAYDLCISPQHYEGAELGEGQHRFDVRVSDTAGHRATDSRTWTVDTVAPTVTIGSGPSGSTSSALASFDFTAAGSPVTTECRLDTGGFGACTSPRAYSTLADGPHTFTVKVTDAAGNSSTDDAAWTVDSTRPQTTIDSGPAGTVAETSALVDFSADEAATFRCSLDGAAFAVCTRPATLTGLAEGDHSFRVRAVDAVGNTDATPASIAWRIALLQQPQVQGQAGAGGTKKPKCKKAKKRAAGKSAKKGCKKRKKA